MSGEQSEERVTLWRWTVEQGGDGTGWRTSRPPVRPDLNDFEVREFVSPSPVDTEGLREIETVCTDRIALGKDSVSVHWVREQVRAALSESDHGLSEGPVGGFTPELRGGGPSRKDGRVGPLAESDQLGSEGDTDFCPTCGSKVRSKTGGGYRLTQRGSCPDPWHSRSQAGEG